MLCYNVNMNKRYIVLDGTYYDYCFNTVDFTRKYYEKVLVDNNEITFPLLKKKVQVLNNYEDKIVIKFNYITIEITKTPTNFTLEEDYESFTDCRLRKLEGIIYFED